MKNFTYFLNFCVLTLCVWSVPASLQAESSKSDDANVLSYMKGRQKVLDGQLEEAVPFFEAALKQDPNSAAINHELSEIYLRLGSPEKAESLSRKAVENNPTNAEYRMTFGGILATLKKYPEAKEQYSKILEIEPSNNKIPLLLGILEAESGNLDEGANILTKSIDANPENYMAYFYRAKIYLEMENLEKAKADLDRALTVKPTFVEAGTALGTLHEKLGEIDQAIAVFSRIQVSGRYKKRLAQLYLSKNEFAKALDEFLEYEKVDDEDYSVKVKIGLLYFELKRYQDAIDRFHVILKAQPQAGNVRFYLGVVYEEMKKPEKAIVEFKKVPKDSSFFKEAVLHVGFIYREQNKLKDGAEFARKILAQNAEVVEFYDMSASFFEAQKDFKKALATIQTGIKKFPNDEKLLYFEGALHDKMGAREKSIGNMKRILEVNPNNAHALNFLGYTYAEMGKNLDEAEQYIQKALTLRPSDGYIEDSLGWIYFRQGKVEKAIAQLEKASKLQPEEAIIYEHLGDVYSSAKQSDKAVEMYKKALALSEKRKDKDGMKKVSSKLASVEKEKRLPSNQ